MNYPVQTPLYPAFSPKRRAASRPLIPGRLHGRVMVGSRNFGLRGEGTQERTDVMCPVTDRAGRGRGIRVDGLRLRDRPRRRIRARWRLRRRGQIRPMLRPTRKTGYPGRCPGAASGAAVESSSAGMSRPEDCGLGPWLRTFGYVSRSRSTRRPSANGRGGGRRSRPSPARVLPSGRRRCIPAAIPCGSGPARSTSHSWSPSGNNRYRPAPGCVARSRGC